MPQVMQNRPPHLERKVYKQPKKFKKRKPKSETGLIKKWIKRLFLLGLALFLIFIIYLIGAFAWYSRDLPNPDKLAERNIAQSTKIYDREGETILYDVHGDEKRTLVKLEDIPDYVKWATISAEDKNFYQHHGFNLLATFKGVIIDPIFGKRARGGSTLTQQFVKNAILTNERRISRKIKEFILSYRIEKMFSKDEILQMYLNEIPYGSVAYGIQSASQSFLGKNAQDLTLGEATILAALPQAPTYYSPYGSHVDRLYVRQKYVLDQMVKNGYITQEQADNAAAEEIKFIMKRESILAPHFVMYVKEFLSEQLGDDLLERGGLKVITTLDLEKQQAAEEAVQNGVEARGQDYGFHNAALVSLDPKNGQILAMVGSKDYFDIENDGNVNVTLSLRQPGSSMKPLVYAAAFQKGYTPNTIIYDTETTFKTETKDYHPLNYDLKQHGPVSIRKALQGSLNIPAVKALYLVGVQEMIDLLELMGYTSFEDRSRFGLSLVLGGGEVQLLEHVSAFGAIANQGEYNPPVGILKVEDSNGNTLIEFKEKSRKVMDKKITNILSNVLSDDGARAYAFGSGGALTLPGRPAATKTGTTNDYRDAWTIGYTPSLVTGVWVGNNDNSEMNRGAAGGVIAAPIWHEYMENALSGTEVESFPGVSIEKTGKPILDGEISGEETIKIDKFSGKLATELTPASAIEEKVFAQHHCLLHYVDKDNPLGDSPSDPAKADPGYVYWEEGVRQWLEAEREKAIEEGKAEQGKEISYESPPTEYDDVHTEENKPTIFIKSPNNNSDISSGLISANVQVSAPRGVDRVEYYIDENLIATKERYPYSLNYSISSYFVKGFHQLRAVAYDDVDNSNEAAVNINVNIDLPAPNLEWSSNNPVQVNGADFPIAIAAKLTDRAASKKVRFYQKKKSGSSVNNFVTVILPESSIITIDWSDPEYGTGEYEIYAEIIDPNGDKHYSDPYFINVD